VTDFGERTTWGFAILGQKQYPSALVRYWALARAEVFQSSFVLYLYICFSIVQRFRAEVFKIPQHRKALSLPAIKSPMRLLLISILSCLTVYSVKCQTKTTPKTYRYFSEKENWVLRIFDYKTFELLVGIPDESFKYLIDGNCTITDSTFQFHSNPSRSLDLIKNDTPLFRLNVRELINGRIFKKIEDCLIPISLRQQEYNKIKKIYFQQVELYMGGTKIELYKHNKYTMTITGCKNKWIEKGNYIRKDNFIVLTPNNKSNKFSTRILDGDKAIFTKDFLITKKIELSLQPENFLKEENFVYYIRM
jgi:hypothetical protein